MKCVLHIGTEKTGTTTLQHFLHANKSALEKIGYGVLSSVGVGNNRRLASYAMRDNHLDDYHSFRSISTPEMKKEHDLETEIIFEKELKEYEEICHTVVITSEHFHSRCIHKDEVEKLKKLLDKNFDEVKVIVYFRPQIDVAISLYTTILRSGSKAEFQEFLSKHCRMDNYYYDYNALLNMWSSVFGKKNVYPKIFDKEKLLEGDLVKDFLNFLNIEKVEEFHFYKNSNESLTPFGQELLRLNNLYPYNFSYKHVPFKNLIYSQTNQLFVGKGAQPNIHDAQQIQMQFHDSNRKVAQEWFETDELFSIDYSKYNQENKIAENEKKMLQVLFESHNEYVDQDTNSIRDAAIALENTDIILAETLMSLANKMRPSGHLIKKKLEEYRQLITAEKKI